MDPLTLGIAGISMGMQLFGGLKSSSAASQAAGIQQNIIGDEEKENSLRQTAMEVSARRQSLEGFRRTQQLVAQSKMNATGGGSQFGSGLAGGLGQVKAEGLFNDQGIKQNLGIGEGLFSLDNQIDQQKIALSGVNSSIATDQSISNFGAALGKQAGTISNIYGYATASKNSTDLSTGQKY